MKHELDTLTEEYISQLRKCSAAKTLEQLQDAYTNASSTRDELYEYIYSAYDDNQSDELEAALADFIVKEATITDEHPFPTFDDTVDGYELFEDYPTYFQRFGCMNTHNIVSWDDSNILFHDIDSDLIEIIQRPDVLMQGM